MESSQSIFALAANLIFSGDADLYAIIGLSLQVSLSATLIGCLIGLPIAAMLVVLRFPGRGLLVAVLNAFMGLPPVVVGLVIYLILSRQGPLGVLGLLYSPSAMIIAQTCLIAPLIAALARQVLADLQIEYGELFASLRLGAMRQISTLIWEGRYSLSTAALAGFGRAIAEVGAVMIVGGNIEHVTRVMTTTIALETSKGNLALALALGVILVALSIVVNIAVAAVAGAARKRAYA